MTHRDRIVDHQCRLGKVDFTIGQLRVTLNHFSVLGQFRSQIDVPVVGQYSKCGRYRCLKLPE